MTNQEENTIDEAQLENVEPQSTEISEEAKIETSTEVTQEPAKETEKKLSFTEKMQLMAAKAKEMGEKANGLKDKALDMSNKATEMAKSFTGKAKDIKETATEKFEEAKEKTSEIADKAKEIKETAVEKIDEAKEKATEISTQAKQTIDIAKEKGSETIDKVSEIKENAVEKASEIKEAVASKPAETNPEKPKSFFERAKEMATKTMETGANLLEKTVPYMKTADEYEKIKDEKILAILFIKKDESESKKFLFKMPLIIKGVWANGVTFKVVDIDELKEITTKLTIEKVPTLLVFEKGEEKKRTTNIEDINKYLKDFTV